MNRIRTGVTLLLAGVLLTGCTTAAAPVPEEKKPALSYAESSSAVGPVRPEQAPLPWNLVLVNGDNRLTEDAAPPSLTELQEGKMVDSRIYDALEEMLNAAEEAGMHPLVCSAYRTWEYQQGLYDELVEKNRKRGLSPSEAEADAGTWIAVPGASEHQTGLAVDIVDLNYQSLDRHQEKTATQKWLMKHCAEYGFILRYPSDKCDITGISYEPWHYRYVGLDAAEEIMEQGISLEEYLAGHTAIIDIT